MMSSDTNEFAEKLIAEDKVKPIRKDVRPGGLEGVFDGLKDLKEGKVSGTKIVYRIGEDEKSFIMR